MHALCDRILFNPFSTRVLTSPFLCVKKYFRTLAESSLQLYPRDLCSAMVAQHSEVYLWLSMHACDRIVFNPFSRKRSKGSRFTLGVWGLRVCSLDVAFTVATVRNRSRDCYMAVPMLSSAEVVIFGGFKRLVASFRVAGVALRDIQTCFVTCRKSFCVAGAILLRRFQKMRCSFRGRRSTLDVSRWVFFANRIGRAASGDDKLQIPWQAWHFVTCAENWRKPCTKHRFWGRKISGSWKKLVGKRRFWCYKVWKSEQVSHEMLVLMLPRVSSRVSGLLVVSPCLWGKLQNMDFRHVSNCENWRRSRTKCWFWCSYVSCLGSLVFLWRRRVYGGSCETSPFRRFPSRLSCRFAWQAWHFVTFQPVW